MIEALTTVIETLFLAGLATYAVLLWRMQTLRNAIDADLILMRRTIVCMEAWRDRLREESIRLENAQRALGMETEEHAHAQA